MPRDHYEVLGLSRDATPDQIKSAYRKLVLQYHPDRNPGDKEAEAKFKEVQAAYDVLSDEKKREAYNRFGHAFQEAGAGGPHGGPFGGWSFRWGGQQGEGGPGGEGFNVSPEMFEEILGGLGGFADLGRGGRAGARRGSGRRQRRAAQDVEHTIEVDFLTAARGGIVPLLLHSEDGAPGEKRIDVTIPAGIAEGKSLRVKGQGVAGGDLYVRVHIRPHPHLRREGQNLIMEAPISVAEAILGAKIDVPTLEGLVTVTVPAGASSGQRLRLRGRGLPTPGSDAKGDLYIELKVVVPDKVDDASKDLIQQFARRNPQEPRAGYRWGL
jgi:curved DNA-binding protein